MDVGQATDIIRKLADGVDPTTGVSLPGLTNLFTYLDNGLLKTASNSVGVVSNTWGFANRLMSRKSE
jgi:hypothetical protein